MGYREADYWIWVNGNLIDERYRTGIAGNKEKLEFLADVLENIPEVKTFEITMKNNQTRKTLLERIFDGGERDQKRMEEEHADWLETVHQGNK
jgi:hypothetical protein